MPGQLINKVALITGASSGIGQAVAMRFLREGASVVAFSRSRSVIEDPHLLEAVGDRFLSVEGDVRSASDNERAVLEALTKFGRLDVLVANAGVDHGCNLPLLKIGLKRTTRVIPIIINSIFPPLPTLQRCVALGERIGQIIRQAGLNREVAILATGGLSHAVGTPGMEINDPAFDQRFIGQLVAGDLQAACAYMDEALDARGNGTHEIRTWLVAAGAALPLRPRVICELPYVDGWYTGIHQLMWDRA